MEQLRTDLRLAARLLARSPGFTAVATLSLALGIAANTTIFSLFDALLLAPLPGREPSRLATVYTSDYSGPLYGASSYPDYRDFRSASPAFEGLAAYAVKPFLLTAGGESRRVLASLVSGNFFEVLGLSAAYGRPILRDEEHGPHPVVVLSHAFWRGRFGADPRVVGQSVALNGRPFTVVGIGPPGFTGLVRGVALDAFIPISMDPVLTGDSLESRGNRGLFLVGRLREGVPAEQARAELAVVAERLHASHPGEWTDRRGEPRAVSVLPEDASRVLPAVRGPIAAFLGVLFAAVGLVLLVACSNVASLLLARASARRREIAVRIALGARGWQLVRQLLTESLLLSALAGALGVGLATLAVELILSFHPPLPFDLALGLELDGRVLLFALLVSLATGVGFGLLPALRAARTSPLESLKAGGGPSARRRAVGLRDALVIGKVAGSLVLLVGAGLFLRSLANAQTIDPGFDPERALVFSLDLAAQGYEPERGAALYSALQDRLGGTPGVTGVSFSTHLPLSLGGERRSLRVLGYEPGPGEDMEVHASFVGADYFRTMKTALARGRGFTSRDAPGTRPVVVVNEAFVRRYWPGSDGLGERIALPWDGDEVEMEVVGVARDGKYGSLGEPPTPHVFYPHRQLYRSQMAVVVRTQRDPAALAPAIRRQVKELDPTLAVYDVKTLAAHLGTALFPARAAAGLLGLTGGLGLFLAAIGLYGLLSYLVTLRTREIGVRMALGARQEHVVRLIVGRGLLLAGAGLAIGFSLAAGLTRFASFLLYGTSPLDPLTFAAVMALLLGVSFAASWRPARRAALVEPTAALRDE